jgi:hypothetical protein
VQGENNIKIIAARNNWPAYFRSIRANLGKSDSDNKKKYVGAKYRYLIKDSTIFKGFKGKEKLFRDSSLENPKEIKNLLGYYLK